MNKYVITYVYKATIYSAIRSECVRHTSVEELRRDFDLFIGACCRNKQNTGIFKGIKFDIPSLSPINSFDIQELDDWFTNKAEGES